MDWEEYRVPTAELDGITTLWVRDATESERCGVGGNCGVIGFKAMAFYREAMRPGREDECLVFCPACWERTVNDDLVLWNDYRRLTTPPSAQREE